MKVGQIVGVRECLFDSTVRRQADGHIKGTCTHACSHTEAHPHMHISTYQYIFGTAEKKRGQAHCFSKTFSYCFEPLFVWSPPRNTLTLIFHLPSLFLHFQVSVLAGNVLVCLSVELEVGTHCWLTPELFDRGAFGKAFLPEVWEPHCFVRTSPPPPATSGHFSSSGSHTGYSVRFASLSRA